MWGEICRRNMWHGCGDYSLEAFLAGKSERARALFDGFSEPAHWCGPVTVVPTKTRVAFMVRVRFCGVERLSSRSLGIGIGLPYALHSPRVRKMERLGPAWHVHYLTIRSLEELDDELRGWLCDAYRLMGEQRRFDVS
jgi:Domain of unknown function (DUF5655)